MRALLGEFPLAKLASSLSPLLLALAIQQLWHYYSLDFNYNNLTTKMTYADVLRRMGIPSCKARGAEVVDGFIGESPSTSGVWTSIPDEG